MYVKPQIAIVEIWHKPNNVLAHPPPYTYLQLSYT